MQRGQKKIAYLRYLTHFSELSLFVILALGHLKKTKQQQLY